MRISGVSLLGSMSMLGSASTRGLPVASPSWNARLLPADELIQPTIPSATNTLHSELRIRRLCAEFRPRETSAYAPYEGDFERSHA